MSVGLGSPKINAINMYDSKDDYEEKGLLSHKA